MKLLSLYFPYFYVKVFNLLFLPLILLQSFYSADIIEKRTRFDMTFFSLNADRSKGFNFLIEIIKMNF